MKSPLQRVPRMRKSYIVRRMKRDCSLWRRSGRVFLLGMTILGNTAQRLCGVAFNECNCRGRRALQGQIPPEINGFEYEVREVTRSVIAGKVHSDIFTPDDSIVILRLIDNIRNSRGMKFFFE